MKILQSIAAGLKKNPRPGSSRRHSKITLTLKRDRKVIGLSIQKAEAKVEVSNKDFSEAFWKNERSVIVQTTFDNQPAIIAFLFEPSTAAEVARSSVQNLQDAMGRQRRLMSENTQERIGRLLAVSVALGELNPISKAAFALAKTVSELVKEQQKYDEMVSDLAQSIGGILPFANTMVSEVIIGGDMALLGDSVNRMFKIVDEAACFICEYIRQQPIVRTVKAIIIPENQKRIRDLAGAFTNLKESFDRALSVETLKEVKNAETKRILERLQPALHAVYDEARKCMDGTRTEILADMMSWTNSSNAGKIYWLHGTPGLGKTALAASLCVQLHNDSRLAGSYFCRRDDPILSQQKNLIPTLIYQLAESWAQYRRLLAQALSDDPRLSSTSPSQLIPKLLLDPLDSLKEHPPQPLVLVLDALDECGDEFSRRFILAKLLEATSRASWLKIIITSRPEDDIQSFFRSQRDSGYISIRDLVQVQAFDDIHHFMQKKMESIAANCRLQDWPGEVVLDKIAERSGGLFIYADTIYQFVRGDFDPEHALEQILAKAPGRANKGLDELYQQAIQLVTGNDDDKIGKVKRVVGAIIAVSRYRALKDDTLAVLLKVKPQIVKVVADKLNSLFYRDVIGGGLRARHLSIIDFFVNPTTPDKFRVELDEANAELGIECLKTMTKELSFNICQLETSYAMNSDVVDLEDRIQRYISDALQYSCVFFADHLSSSGDPSDDTKHQLEGLLGCEKALFWVEVLSLLSKAPITTASLRKLRAWLKNHQKSCLQLVVDALRFCTTFYAVIASSAPHIYISALPFSPSQSLIWNNTKKSFYNLLEAREGRLETWPAFPHEWPGHTGVISSLASSPDGLKVASGSLNSMVCIWDAETGEVLGNPLIGHTDCVTCVVFSPDGLLIISSSLDHTVRIWDAETGEPTLPPLFGHSERVNGVACSPDGSRIASASDDRTIRTWDLRTGEPVGQPLKGHTEAVTAIAYSPSGAQLVSGSEDKTIRLWDAQTGEPINQPFTGHTDWVTCITFSPDGTRIASGSRDGTVRIWNPETGEEVREATRSNTMEIWCIAFSSDGLHIASGSYRQTVICDAHSGKEVGRLDIFADAIIYTPDETIIVGGSNFISVWNAQTYQPKGLVLDKESFGTIACSPSRSHIITTSAHGGVQIWNIETGKAKVQTVGDVNSNIIHAYLSPNGNHIAACYIDDTIRIWDLHTGNPVGQSLKGDDGRATAFAYCSKVGRLVSGYEDKTIRLWDAQTGESIGQPLLGHTSEVTCIAFSPDGTQIASGSKDGTVCIWNARTGEAVGEPLTSNMTEIFSLAFSPDGYHIACSVSTYPEYYAASIFIWHIPTGKIVQEIPSRRMGSVFSIVYSPDNAWIASGSYNGKICISNPQTGGLVGHPLIGHTGQIISMALPPDGSQIVSCSRDGTVRVWDPQTAPFYSLKLGLNIDLDVEIDDNGWIRPTDEDDLRILMKYFCRIQKEEEELISIMDHDAGRSQTDGESYTSPAGRPLVWIPEDYRQGLTCAAIRTMPSFGPNRRVRVDISQMLHGPSWTEIYVPSSKKTS